MVRLSVIINFVYNVLIPGFKEEIENNGFLIDNGNLNGHLLNTKIAIV